MRSGFDSPTAQILCYIYPIQFCPLTTHTRPLDAIANSITHHRTPHSPSHYPTDVDTSRSLVVILWVGRGGGEWGSARTVGKGRCGSDIMVSGRRFDCERVVLSVHPPLVSSLMCFYAVMLGPIRGVDTLASDPLRVGLGYLRGWLDEDSAVMLRRAVGLMVRIRPSHGRGRGSIPRRRSFFSPSCHHNGPVRQTRPPHTTFYIHHYITIRLSSNHEFTRPTKPMRQRTRKRKWTSRRHTNP